MRALVFPDTLAHWQPLTRPRASDLQDTRLQLHWAAQLVAALGTTLLEPRADDSHTSLVWSQAHRGLLGQPVGGPARLRALLRFPDVTIDLLRGEGDDERTLKTWPLAGRRFAEILAELEAAVGEALGQPDLKLRRPALALPEHRVDPSGAGEPFGGWKDFALVELTRWFANGDRALRELAKQDRRATPVRCWPHHFDIAILLVLDREDPSDPGSEVTRSRAARGAIPRAASLGLSAEGFVAETCSTPGTTAFRLRALDENSCARRHDGLHHGQLGVGMTPGDGSYADAYWYVTPWPYPAAPELGELEGGGIWHRDGWVGAVLTSTALREPQAERFTAFLRSALAACEAMVV